MTTFRRKPFLAALLLPGLLAGAFFSTTSAQMAQADDTTIDAKAIAQAMQHNLEALNAYRTKAGAPALKLDGTLSTFAKKGSEELKRNHKPHDHFKKADIWHSGFQGGAAENQGDPHGWPVQVNLNSTINDILKMMMDEGPGGGHHDNMLNPIYRRVGVGLVMDGDKLYFTNDFSK